MQAILLTVKPGKRPGTFDAYLGDEKLCTSRTPFFTGARRLIERGVAPSKRLAMRHAGDDYDSLTSTVGEAARWTIEEGVNGLVRRPYRHIDLSQMGAKRKDVPSPVRQNEVSATHVA